MRTTTQTFRHQDPHVGAPPHSPTTSPPIGHPSGLQAADGLAHFDPGAVATGKDRSDLLDGTSQMADA